MPRHRGSLLQKCDMVAAKGGQGFESHLAKIDSLPKCHDVCGKSSKDKSSAAYVSFSRNRSTFLSTNIKKPSALGECEDAHISMNAPSSGEPFAKMRH